MALSEYTVMSLLKVPHLIKVSPTGPASCHKIEAPPQNRSAWCITWNKSALGSVLAPGTSNRNITVTLLDMETSRLIVR